MNLVPLTVPLLLPDWLDPAHLIGAMGNWALWGVALIIVIECAIFPILPGDSLLFTVGMFVAMTPPSITFGDLDKPAVLTISCLVLTIAAVLGNVIGYFVGQGLEHVLFKPRTGFWGKVFDPKYIQRTHEFLERYGPRALVLARFVPFVRTFITLIAGIGEMSFRKFITWTGVGAVLWAVGVTVLGYFLGSVPLIGENIDAVLVLIVLISLVPMVVEFFLERRRQRARATVQAP